MRGERLGTSWSVFRLARSSDFKHMPSVGLGVQEIRVRIGGAFRVIYVAKFAEAIYVLHAFQKKSRQTNKSDIELARQRFKALLQERKRK